MNRIPKSTGMYDVTLLDGRTMRAWYSAESGHWLDETRTNEIGFHGHLLDGTVEMCKAV